MRAPEYRIAVGASFEPLASSLTRTGCVEVLSRSESHVLFVLDTAVVALARPADEERVAEVLVFDPTGGMIASNFSEVLRGHLDHDVARPVRSDHAGAARLSA